MKYSRELSQYEHCASCIQFELGEIIVKDSVLMLVEANAQPEGIYLLLERHRNCDWGELCAEGKAKNDEATQSDGRIFSSYVYGKEQVWIITAKDRSTTTVLLIDDYQ